LTVQGRATLTIDPGVTVCMAVGSRLTVQNGSLRSVALVGQRIRVVSDRTRTQGVAAPGDWAHWVFDSGAVNTLLDGVDFEHGQGLLIRGSAPVLNRVDIRSQAGPAISIDLLASPTGVANSASGNALNGIQVPAGDIVGKVRWGLRGIPYVIDSGTVPVGASPQVDSLLPATVEQGATVTLSVSGTRLGGLTSAALDQAGLVLTPFSGGSASQLFMQLRVDPAAPLGAAALRLQVDAGEVVVAIAVTVTQAMPAISSISPSSVLAGAEPTAITVSGRNFLAGSEILVNSASLSTVVVSATGLQATLPRQTATANLQLQVRSPDPLRPGQSLLSNPVNFSVMAPVPPLLAVEPTPIALAPDNKSRDVTVRLSKADYRDNTVTASVADPTKASVSPQTLVIAAGQTSARLAITLLASGTSLILDSATLARISLPLFITADFRGANTAYAAPVGVVIETDSAPASAPVTLSNAAVGVAVGAVLTLSGVRFEPAQGISVDGTLDASADGLTLGFTATVATEAAPCERVVVVSSSAAGDSTLVPQSRNQIRIARQVGPTIKDLASQAVGVVNGPQDTLARAPSTTLAAPLVGRGCKRCRSREGDSGCHRRRRGDRLDSAVDFAQWLAARRFGNPHGQRAGSGSRRIGAVDTGLLLGSPVVSADGSALAISLAVAPDAPLSPRRLRLATGAAEVVFQVADAALLAIGSVPTMTSLSPIAVEQGRSTKVLVRGSRLKGVTGAAFEPAPGLLVTGPLLWAQDALGETLTVPVWVDAAAPTGLRVLRLLVPGGATAAQASPVNSIAVITPQ
jgi:hypothetical protein